MDVALADLLVIACATMVLLAPSFDTEPTKTTAFACNALTAFDLIVPAALSVAYSNEDSTPEAIRLLSNADDSEALVASVVVCFATMTALAARLVMACATMQPEALRVCAWLDVTTPLAASGVVCRAVIVASVGSCDTILTDTTALAAFVVPIWADVCPAAASVLVIGRAMTPAAFRLPAAFDMIVPSAGKPVYVPPALTTATALRCVIDVATTEPLAGSVDATFPAATALELSVVPTFVLIAPEAANELTKRLDSTPVVGSVLTTARLIVALVASGDVCFATTVPDADSPDATRKLMTAVAASVDVALEMIVLFATSVVFALADTLPVAILPCGVPALLFDADAGIDVNPLATTVAFAFRLDGTLTETTPAALRVPDVLECIEPPTFRLVIAFDTINAEADREVVIFADA
jgi:hypothetical protein